MDSFDNIPPVAGSRRPILVPAYSDSSSSPSHFQRAPSTVVSKPTPSLTRRSRRKPVNVFKSPSADDNEEWEGHSCSRKQARPYERVAGRRASTSTDTSHSSHSLTASLNGSNHPPLPSLPLYHPLGPLAQSLPPLDPATFGLPSSLSIDDVGEQNDGENGGRSSSRARRAPKSREAGEDESTPNGAANGTDTAQDAPAKERNSSPRKKRGGGAKRKRRDTDDGDAGFPPPAKRTRNPRGAAANNAPAAPSPLVGPAVVASDLVEDIPETNGEGEDQPQEVQAPKRSARVRKPRARVTKRRDSTGSATSGTSVSVSIAAATKTGPHAPKESAGPVGTVDGSAADTHPMDVEPLQTNGDTGNPGHDATTEVPDRPIRKAATPPVEEPPQREPTPAQEPPSSVTPPAVNGDIPKLDVKPPPQSPPPPPPQHPTPHKPKPEPASEPAREPAPEPEPEPTSVPAPEPVPAPALVPAPAPAPEPPAPKPIERITAKVVTPPPVPKPAPKVVHHPLPPRPVPLSVPPPPSTHASVAAPAHRHVTKPVSASLPPPPLSRPPPKEEREEGELSDD